MTYEIHPLAELIPPMTGVEFAELRASIKTRGYLDDEPVILYEGKILDGRHRERAARELGVTPLTKQYEGDDPIGYVLAKNLDRRHLTTGQRSASALKLLDYEKAEARERQGTRTDLDPTSGATDHKVDEEASKAASRAGGKFGVSRSSVERARTVAEERPDLLEKVEAGEMTVNAAFNEAKGKEPERKPIDLTNEHNRRRAEKQLERLWSLLSALDGARIGLETFDVGRALAIASAEDVNDMDRMLGASAKAFSRLRSEIKQQKGL